MFDAVDIKRYAKRYTVNNTYTVVRFFHRHYPQQKFHDIVILLRLLRQKKLILDDIETDYQTINVTEKIHHSAGHVFFQGINEIDGVRYLNMYPTTQLLFNEKVDRYYQWVNLKSFDIYLSTDFLFSYFAIQGEVGEIIMSKLVIKNTLVI